MKRKKTKLCVKFKKERKTAPDLFLKSFQQEKSNRTLQYLHTIDAIIVV